MNIERQGIVRRRIEGERLGLVVPYDEAAAISVVMGLGVGGVQADYVAGLALGRELQSGFGLFSYFDVGDPVLVGPLQKVEFGAEILAVGLLVRDRLERAEVRVKISQIVQLIETEN